MSLFAKSLQMLPRLPAARAIRQAARPVMRELANKATTEVADLVIIGDGIAGRQAQSMAVALARVKGTEVQVVAKKPTWLRLSEGLRRNTTVSMPETPFLGRKDFMTDIDAQWEAMTARQSSIPELSVHKGELLSLKPAGEHYELEVMDADGKPELLKAQSVLVANGTHSLLSENVLADLEQIHQAHPAMIFDTIDYLTRIEPIENKSIPVIVHGSDSITMVAVRSLLEQKQPVTWLSDTPIDTTLLNYELSSPLQAYLDLKIGSINHLKLSPNGHIQLRCASADGDLFDIAGQQLIVDLTKETTAVDLLADRLSQAQLIFSPAGSLARDPVSIGYVEQTDQGARAYYVGGAADDIARARYKIANLGPTPMGYSPADASPASRTSLQTSQTVLNELFSVKSLHINWDEARLSDIRIYLDTHHQYLNWSESMCVSFSERLMNERAKRPLTQSRVSEVFKAHIKDNHLDAMPTRLLEHLSCGEAMIELRRTKIKP